MNIYIGEPVVVSDMQGPCDDGFHVPTKDEWDTLSNFMTGLSQSTAFVEKLHIPLAGYRSYSTGAVTEQGTTARFWTSIRNNNSNSNEVDITTSGYSTQNRGTGFAYTIRPFKNTSVTPTSSWTTIYQGSGSAGIFWNQTDGLISISSNGSTWYTIADKNLGATTVWNSGDTISESNCGKFYQRGNNYGFPFSGSITTSYTQVNASTYGPGNYYSSSTFILDGDWETSVNKNLRGGVSQGTSTKSVEVKNIYIGEYGWKPGANTILYLPMTSNFDDATGNNTMSNSGATIVDLNGVKCGYFNSKRLTCSASPLNTMTKTLSVWVYITGDSYGWVIGSNHAGAWSGDYWTISSSILHYEAIYGTSNTKNIEYNNSISKNGRHHICVTGTDMYLDGVLVGSNSNIGTFASGYPYTIGQQNNGNNSLIGYLSEFIVENKSRTAEEVSDYYNQTKSNYGL